MLASQNLIVPVGMNTVDTYQRCIRVSESTPTNEIQDRQYRQNYYKNGESIENRIVLTLNETPEMLDDAGVVIFPNESNAVGPVDQLEANYDANRTLDASGHAVLPRSLIRTPTFRIFSFVDRHKPRAVCLDSERQTARGQRDDDADRKTTTVLFPLETIRSETTTFVEELEMQPTAIPTRSLNRYHKNTIRMSFLTNKIFTHLL